MAKRKHRDLIPSTSSSPPRLPKRQAELFRDVLRALEGCGIPYVVSGAFAMRQHTGVCRDTKDLDVFLTVEDASVALQHLADQGMECEIRDPVWLAKATRNNYFVDLITGMSNGLIRVDSSWIERSHPAIVLGIETRVLAPEELIASKLFVVRRERFDGADIAHLIYTSRGNLNWDRIMQVAGEHWEMVLWALMLYRYVYPGQSDFVPRTLWRDLLVRLQHTLISPTPDAKFRGSLVDDRMFAIDVNEWGLANLLQESRARSARISSQVAERCA